MSVFLLIRRHVYDDTPGPRMEPAACCCIWAMSIPAFEKEEEER